MASRKEELSLDGAEGFGVLDREKGCCEEVVGTWWIKEGRGELKKRTILTCNLTKRSCKYVFSA